MSLARDDSLARWASDTLRALTSPSTATIDATIDDLTQNDGAPAHATTRPSRGATAAAPAGTLGELTTAMKRMHSAIDPAVFDALPSDAGGVTLEDVWRDIQNKQHQPGAANGGKGKVNGATRNATTNANGNNDNSVSMVGLPSLGTMKFSQLLSAMAAPEGELDTDRGTKRTRGGRATSGANAKSAEESRDGNLQVADPIPGVSYAPVKLKKRSNIPTPVTRPALPPKRMGRRPKDAVPESEEEKQLRMQERLFRNRESAARSREKRLSAMKIVEDENARLRKENAALKETIAKLQGKSSPPPTKKRH